MTDAFVVFDIFMMESGSTHDYDLKPSSYSHTITRFLYIRNCQLNTYRHVWHTKQPQAMMT